jgi:hypothetical protein
MHFKNLRGALHVAHASAVVYTLGSGSDPLELKKCRAVYVTTRVP